MSHVTFFTHERDAEKLRCGILSGLIGVPWRANAAGPDAYDCWHLSRHIELTLFGHVLPDVAVPDHPSWRWMIEAIETHPERIRWQETAQPHGLIMAADGALVLMARSDRPAHIGVWLAPERRIIHADQDQGVVLDQPSLLRAGGWRTLRFFEQRSATSSCPGTR